MNEILTKIIGEIIVYGGSSVAIAYGAFRFFSKKWLENKFAQSLEDYKNMHRKEIEDLKFQINSQFNRISKIHEKEIEVLPECWSRLHEAKSYISSFVSPLQTYPGFQGRSEEEIRAILAKTPFETFQVETLLNHPDPNKYYQETLFWHNVNESEKIFRNFYSYVVKNKIFLNDELKVHFEEAGDLLWDAISGKKIGKQCDDHKMAIDAYRKLRDNIDKILSDIEKKVQERLHYFNA